LRLCLEAKNETSFFVCRGLFGPCGSIIRNEAEP
jgi:hypothetical protein